MNINFSKFQATGNDFVMIDNRDGLIELTDDEIQKLCSRKFGIGADGLIMLCKSEDNLDFKMRYFNSDASEAFCGNGARCTVKFAKMLGIRKDKYVFSAIDGTHEASIRENGWVNLRMKNVENTKKYGQDTIVNTGTMHYVHFVEGLKDLDVYKAGRQIRMSPDFITDGINVNFVEKLDDSSIFVRTYEKGVEEETLSCGTGVTASALVAAHNDRGFNRVDVDTKGGFLAVEYDRVGDDAFENIYLCGPALHVYEGQTKIECVENKSDIA